MSGKYNLKAYIKKVNKNPGDFTRIHKEINKVSKFKVGDIVNLAYLNYDSNEPTYIHEAYTYNNIKTDVKVKYKVVYTDEANIPHIQKIKQNGEFGNITSILSNMCIWDELDDFNTDFNKAFTYDEDFIDSTIFDCEYNPLISIEASKIDAENKGRILVEEWYRIHAYNKSLRLHSGSKEKIKQLRDKLKIGDTIWCNYIGSLTLKINSADDDIMVFEDGSRRLHAFNTTDLKVTKLYKQSPSPYPCVSKFLLKKYKPNRK